MLRISWPCHFWSAAQWGTSSRSAWRSCTTTRSTAVPLRGGAGEESGRGAVRIRPGRGLCWKKSTNRTSFLFLLGIFTSTTQASKTRAWCMCRRAWMLSPEFSWIPTLFPRTGLLLYEVSETWKLYFFFFFAFLCLSALVSACHFVSCPPPTCCYEWNMKATPSLRMASTWRTVPAPAAPTGWRSTSWRLKTPRCSRTAWRGSSSAACRGLTTERDFFTTPTLTRRERATVSRSKGSPQLLPLKSTEKRFRFRHRDLHQPPPEALLPCFRDVPVWGHAVRWIPWPSQMDERGRGG